MKDSLLLVPVLVRLSGSWRFLLTCFVLLSTPLSGNESWHWEWMISHEIVQLASPITYHVCCYYYIFKKNPAECKSRPLTHRCANWMVLAEALLWGEGGGRGSCFLVPLASAYESRCAASCIKEEGSVRITLSFCDMQKRLQPISLIRSGSPKGTGWVIGICFLFWPEKSLFFSLCGSWLESPMTGYEIQSGWETDNPGRCTSNFSFIGQVHVFVSSWLRIFRKLNKEFSLTCGEKFHPGLFCLEEPFFLLPVLSEVWQHSFQWEQWFIEVLCS